MKPAWICTYYSQESVDVSVYASREDALEGATVTMLAQLHLMSDAETREYILDAVLKREYAEALELFGDVTGESFVIDSKPVIDVKLIDVTNAWTAARHMHLMSMRAEDEVPASEPPDPREDYNSETRH